LLPLGACRLLPLLGAVRRNQPGLENASPDLPLNIRPDCRRLPPARITRDLLEERDPPCRAGEMGVPEAVPIVMRVMRCAA